MISSLNKDFVIFRIPESETIEIIEAGVGDDQFVIAPFNRLDRKQILQGEIKPIEEDSISKHLEACQLEFELNLKHTSQSEYTSSVDLAIQEINKGNFDKVVLAATKKVRTSNTLAEVFFKLMEQNKKAFVYAFRIGSSVMLGASPENLLRQTSNTFETVALGGTLRNGSYGEKELIEHQQIQLYIETILKQETFDYWMDETEVISAGVVEHLSSRIRIKPKSFQDNLKLADRLHPTSAVCGLPFASSLHFITQNESIERGYYSGYLGPIRKNQSFQFFVNLRCASFFKDTVLIYAGAGINGMSNPDDEWEEINKKMQTIALCLK